MSGRSFAFVVPRYFRGIAGGVESLMSELAKRLAARGDRVELLTTCAKDNRTWENFFKPSPAAGENEDGIIIRRFAVDPRNIEIWLPIQVSIDEGMTPAVDNQLDWMANSVNSTTLYNYLANSADKFDAVFFGPYLFGTTFWGSQIAPHKSFLIPCLHDESYAYLDIMGSMFRAVRGCLFNALPEMELAHKLFGEVPGGEVGMGFEKLDNELLSTLNKSGAYFKDQFPYFMYLGRKETGKGVHKLIDNFIELKESSKIAQELKLVIAGGGSFSDLHRPKAIERTDIIDLTDISEIDKLRLLKNAASLIQPSTNESFSIVLMEAWRLGTPVIVNGDCAVTRYHVLQSGGGLYYSEPAELGEVLTELSCNSELRVSLGLAGKRYLEEQYNWGAVLGRFEDVYGKVSRGMMELAGTSR